MLKFRKIDMLNSIILLIILILSFVPIFMMLSMSFRDMLAIYADFWGSPWPFKWSNYSDAMLNLVAPALRTLYICFFSIAGILILGCLCAYAFARLRFFGREVLFLAIVFMMTVPKTLQLTPNFILADFLNLRNTFTGLLLFYIGGGLLFAIFLLRTFFQTLPNEMFESARVEGASEYRCVWRIAVPLAWPILITVALMTFINLYNDLIWPLLMINSIDKQTLAVALNSFSPQSGGGEYQQFSRPDLGVMTAGYVFSSIPVFIVFMFGMKYFVAGLTSGAIKS